MDKQTDATGRPTTPVAVQPALVLKGKVHTLSLRNKELSDVRSTDVADETRA